MPSFFKKLIFGRRTFFVIKYNCFLDIQTHESLITPVELIVELHKIKTSNIKEKGHLIQSNFNFCSIIIFKDLDLLLVDQTKEFNLTKDVFANAVEILVDTPNLPSSLILHTIQKIQENYPALNGYLSNILVKLNKKKDT